MISRNLEIIKIHFLELRCLFGFVPVPHLGYPFLTGFLAFEHADKHTADYNCNQ